ncbi:DUF87 domain-containing protein [Herbaspirillum seropedicae]|uniref:type IV secretion system DNA-binding domain-containing protein n=1 Tax=Herbaspirillum seropedicae TaxID=964 RepID=UPI0011222780|nr:type IV secretion system DNA-binding domain-containing protein [Herbaspirillum seropedicae]QDD65581.1 DUF87 domain-containing protein [Herbaspirillum seropedicae]
MKTKSKIIWWNSHSRFPSQNSIDPLNWFLVSTCLGIIAFVITLAFLWRPAFGLESPPGALPAHALYLLLWGIHTVMPSVFANETTTYTEHLQHWHQSGQMFGIRVRLVLSFCVGVLPSLFLIPVFLIPQSNFLYLRGPRRFEGRKAVRLLRKQLKGENQHRPDHEIAPNIDFPGSRWTQHLLITGGVGVGKSNAIKPLVKQIIAANEQLILFDPKGDFTQTFKEAIVIAPWDARSWGWDIGKDMRSKADMRRFAAAMIKEAHEPMWSNAARQTVVGYMRYLQDHHRSAWGWKEFAMMFDTPAIQLYSIMQKHHPEAARIFEKLNVTTQGILITLTAHCAPIYDLAMAWEHVPQKRRISFVEWTLKNPKRNRQVILQGNGSYPEMTEAFVPGILSVLSGLISGAEMKEGDGQKIWAVMDEAAEIGRAPIERIFSMGRSRNVRGVLACQNFSQLERHHGKEFVRSLLSMCGTVIVGRTGMGETADAIVRSIGSTEVERRNISISTSSDGKAETVSVSYSREEIPIYKASELSSRLGIGIKKNGVVMALISHGNVYELFWPFLNLAKRRQSHVPAPWMLPDKSLVRLLDRQEYRDALAQEEIEEIKRGSDSVKERLSWDSIDDEACDILH